MRTYRLSRRRATSHNSEDNVAEPCSVFHCRQQPKCVSFAFTRVYLLLSTLPTHLTMRCNHTPRAVCSADSVCNTKGCCCRYSCFAQKARSLRSRIRTRFPTPLLGSPCTPNVALKAHKLIRASLSILFKLHDVCRGVTRCPTRPR